MRGELEQGEELGNEGDEHARSDLQRGPQSPIIGVARKPVAGAREATTTTARPSANIHIHSGVLVTNLPASTTEGATAGADGAS